MVGIVGHLALEFEGTQQRVAQLLAVGQGVVMRNVSADSGSRPRIQRKAATTSCESTGSRKWLWAGLLIFAKRYGNAPCRISRLNRRRSGLDAAVLVKASMRPE